jgi:hypothetical protein
MVLTEKARLMNNLVDTGAFDDGVNPETRLAS